MADIYEITKRLYIAQAAEKAAKDARIFIEKELEDALIVPAGWEGARTTDIGEFKVVAKRTNYTKVDTALLEQITAANKLDKVTKEAFRFKAEINKKAFAALTPYTQGLYAPAITTTAGKMSFTVDIKNKEDK